MSAPLIVGIDPSVTRPAFAALDSKRCVDWLGLIRSGGERTGREGVVDCCELIARFTPPADVIRRTSAVVVESQQSYAYGPERSKPDDLIKLATISGACLARWMQLCPKATFLLPTPFDWKKQVPKRVHQARFLGRLGIGYTAHGTPRKGYCEPVFPQKQLPSLDRITTLAAKGKQEPNPGDWKEISDAIGLALFGVDHAG